jgi:hypothetical protein
MRMCSLEELKWALQFATAGSLHVQQGFEGGGSISEGVTGSDGWTFYHQLRRSTPMGKSRKRVKFLRRSSGSSTQSGSSSVFVVSCEAVTTL